MEQCLGLEGSGKHGAWCSGSPVIRIGIARLVVDGVPAVDQGADHTEKGEEQQEQPDETG